MVLLFSSSQHSFTYNNSQHSFTYNNRSESKLFHKRSCIRDQEIQTTSFVTVGFFMAIAVLVGVLLIMLALFVQRCCFKRKAARATKTDNVYEIVNDEAATTQPASSPPKEYEAIYVLAGDPDVIKLGLWTALLVVGGVVLLLALASLSTRKGFSKRKEDCEMPYDDVYTTVEYATSSKA
ncbi:hypothetical protein SRHO_G00100090 [Serrasalmus rhombeus]